LWGEQKGYDRTGQAADDKADEEGSKFITIRHVVLLLVINDV
jgi:hypothetical protein